MSGIALDEVLAELARLERSADGPDGFTTQDVAEHLGVSHRGAAYRVTEWARAGLIRFVGKRRVTNVAGGSNLVPVYQRCSASSC